MLSGTHFIFPKDPPGFGVLVHLDEVHTLNTERIYVAAIAMVHDWAFQGWNRFFPSRSVRFTKTSDGLTIAWRSVAYVRERNQLQTKHLILGMLHLIDQMTKHQAFCVSTSSVLLYRQPVGHIELLPSESFSRTNTSHETLAMHNISLHAAQAPNPGFERKIVDPADSDFAILYERKGDMMSFVDFMSTVLYAMATAAQASSTDPCRDIAGFNQKRSVVYRIHGKRTTDWSHPLTYQFVRRGLRLLSRAIYDEGDSGEVWFQFLFQGDVLGSGNIVLSDFARSTA